MVVLHKTKYPPICVSCACTLDIDFSEDDQLYPQCSGCQQSKIPVTKKFFNLCMVDVLCVLSIT